jgi:UDP-N-acetylglucosamine 3-dehydrogenase
VRRSTISLNQIEKAKRNMEDSVNIAVIGAGYWGKRVIDEYIALANKNSRVQLSIICDLLGQDVEHCKNALYKTKARMVKDYKQVLSSDHIDAVHICTPNETHYDIGREALMAGKHVLLEKPMSLCARHAWDLVGLAEAKHLCLQVGHIFRFNNAIKTVRDLILENYFAELYYLKLEWTTLMPSPLNRDIIYDLGPHPVDILNYLLNKWPTKVTCRARAYRRKSLEELAYITMDFDGKPMAHIELSWLQPGKTRELILVGSERSARVDCLNQSINICENNDGGGFDLQVAKNNTLLDEVTHFVGCILSNTNSKNHGAVGAKNVTVLEGFRKSLAEERTVNID